MIRTKELGFLLNFPKSSENDGNGTGMARRMPWTHIVPLTIGSAASFQSHPVDGSIWLETASGRVGMGHCFGFKSSLRRIFDMDIH